MRLMDHRLFAFFALFSVTGPVVAQEQAAIPGFTKRSSETQRSRESQLDSLIKRDNLRDWMKRLTAKPHHVGSEYGKDNAVFLLALFKSWGYDARIETFDVLLPVPKTRSLIMTAPKRFTAKLWELGLKEDATSRITHNLLPPYNAYSPDGNVSAEVVYVNYGMPDDYKVLSSKGVDVKGKIVLARYGGGWRGLKPKVAWEHGAIGCLIYSDPKDDGYFQGDVYPKGGYRNENGVQRGSIADMPIYPGDPLTPGKPSIPGIPRLSLKDDTTLCKIPTLPISYGDALPILQSLDGPVVPPDWRGALPATYHFGPGPSKVTLKLEFEWKTVECRDVIAELKGSEKPDQWLIRGNHYDGWTFGAADPISGAVTVLEEARCVGELAKTGWKPKRTIVYCLWDGEEPGLLGSTEWVEKHAAELGERAVAYINSDSTGRGYLGMSGSHTLEPFMNAIARDVRDPETGLTLLERLKAKATVDGPKDARSEPDMPMGALGSGSDYTPFLQHIGVASLNLGFGGEGGGGSYHSTYDSFDHFNRFIDPGNVYGETLVKVAGRSTLRLADADVIPSDPARSVETIAKYLDEVVKLADKMREDTDEKNRQIADGTMKATFDPKEPNILPKPEDPVPHLNFAPLQNAMDRLKELAKSISGEREKFAELSADRRDGVEKLLVAFDRSMLSAAGLPGRTWFKHLIYAPGLYTGYGVKTLPGIREAIEQRQWKAFDDQAVSLAKALERLGKILGEIRDSVGETLFSDEKCGIRPMYGFFFGSLPADRGDHSTGVDAQPAPAAHR